MAHGGQWTITATATSIASALALPDSASKRHFTKVTVKNADGAANSLYAGPAFVTATPTFAQVELGAGDSYTWGGVSGTSVDTSQIYLIGTAAAGNVAFISLEI
jgi:hypothetical protein